MTFLSFAPTPRFSCVLRAVALTAAALVLLQCADTSLSLNSRTAPAPVKQPEKPVAKPEPKPEPVVQTAPPAPTPPPDTGVTVQQAPQLVPPLGATAEPVRVGLLLPLSGTPEARRVGEAMLDSALLALFDLGGERLQLMPRDTMGTAEGAHAAATAALEEGAQLLLGPVFSASVEAVAPLARARGVPMIAYSSDQRVAGDGVFLLSFTPEQEVARVTSYAASQGARRFAALVPEDAYGLAVLEAYRIAVAQNGGELVRTVYVASDGSDAHEPVQLLADYDGRRQALIARRKELQQQGTPAAKRRLAALEKRDTLGPVDFDAVMLPAGGETLRSVAPLLPYYDVDVGIVRLLGTGRWDARGIGHEPAMIGAWFAGADRNAVEVFRGRFEQRFGRPPLRLSSLAYDAAALAALLSQGDGPPDFSIENLTDPAGFSGVDGVFRFLPNGRAERGLAVLEIQRDSMEMISPAPQSFQAPLTN